MVRGRDEFGELPLVTVQAPMQNGFSLTRRTGAQHAAPGTPVAKARKISCPLRTPPSITICILSPSASTIFGR